MRPRLPLAAALVALLTIVLTGCLKLDADLSVSQDDTVSGSFIVAFDRDILELAGEQGDLLTEQIRAGMEAQPPSQGSATVEPYEDDNFRGAIVTYDEVPLDDLNTPAGDAGGEDLTITHDGDQFHVTGELSFDLGETAGELPTGVSVPDLSGILESSDAEVRIRLTFPGKVTEANGDIEGCSVSWEPALTGTTTFEATANDSGSCRTGLRWWAWILFGIGAVVLVLAVLAIIRNLRRDKPTTPPAPPPGAAVDAAATTDVPPESTPLTLPAPPSPGGFPPPTPQAPPTPPEPPTPTSPTG